jgi:hypothetical protein
MSEHINELASALAKAQMNFKAVPKGKTAKVATKNGGEYSYKYADLADAFEACRTTLADNNIAVVQAPAQPDKGVCTVTTMLIHSSGQWMRSTLALDARDATPQSIGSVITYARRYGLAAMIGLVTDDDTDAQEHQPAQRQQSGAQQGQRGGGASYNGNGAQRAASTTKATPPEITAAAVKAAYQEAVKLAGKDVEPLDPNYEQWDATALADWLAYYRSFTLKAAQ